MRPDHDRLVLRFRQHLLPHDPQRHALMLPPDHTHKYHEYPTAPTDAQLADHLAGHITLATPAATADLSALLPLDIDRGGLPVLQALLRAAHARGMWAFGQYCPRPGLEEDAQRGYVWLVFEHLTDATRLRFLGRQLIAAAGVAGAHVEIRAHHAVTRLPLAKHTHTGAFGSLHFQDGTTLAIDADPLAAAAALFDALELVPLARVPAVPSTAERESVAVPVGAQSQDIIRIYNETADLRGLLVEYGAIRASYTLYRCPCGNHTNNDQRPSLGLVRARNPRYGAWMAKGYSPHCAFHTATDAFGVYCHLADLTASEAVKRLAEEWGCTTTRRSRPRTPEPAIDPGPRRPRLAPVNPETSSPEQAAQMREGLWLKLAQDGRLTPSARRVMSYFLREADRANTAWCQQSKAQIAACVGCSVRTVQRATRELHAAGYLAAVPAGTNEGGDTANLYTFVGGGRHRMSPPIKLNTISLRCADPDAANERGRGGNDALIQHTPLDASVPFKDTQNQKPPKAAAPPTRPADDEELVEIRRILEGADRSMGWLYALGTDSATLAQAEAEARWLARRSFAQQRKSAGKRQMWQAKQIAQRLAALTARPAKTARPLVVAPVEAPSPQAERLRALGVYRGSVNHYSQLPLETIERAEALARSIPNARDVGALVISFLREHVMTGWAIPDPAPVADAMPFDLTKYLPGGAFADFFIQSEDTTSPAAVPPTHAAPSLDTMSTTVEQLERPEWIPASVWAPLAPMLQRALAGSRLIDGQVKAASPIQQAQVQQPTVAPLVAQVIQRVQLQR